LRQKIKVHEKALAHLSRGLYRSPASALRELVSNAWDANATAVRITTNFPNFFQLSVEDDGDGFTLEQFEELMAGGIGNSDKRADEKPLKYNRKVIGRLGIGMLGIAQICGAFTVTSRTAGGRGFRARVLLYDLLKQKLDRDDPSVVQPIVDTVTEVDVGEYEVLPFDRSVMKKGTHILADEIHPTFVRAFQESLQAPKYKDPPLAWGKALGIVGRVHSLQELGDYWRLLWELTACCPIPYVSERALPDGLAKKEQARLIGYNFAVIVDGIKLAKPVWLRGNPAGYTARAIPSTSETVYGKNLQFHGYVIVQEGKQIRPDELRGILIRIKDVAIGYYDGTLLDYKYNEGPRSRWLTSEIFVDEGLEDALNVDRDSFNRFHPEYRAIQKHVHNVLHSEIFPEVYQEIEERSKKKTSERENTRKSGLKNVLGRAMGASVQLTFRSSAASEREPDVTIQETTRGARVVVPQPGSIKTKRSNQQLASSLMAIFEVALRERTKERQREVFKQLLLDLLAKW
jgi:hypothetical protein